MFFLYTMVSYIIYVVLQISCILPLSCRYSMNLKTFYICVNIFVCFMYILYNCASIFICHMVFIQIRVDFKGIIHVFFLLLIYHWGIYMELKNTQEKILTPSWRPKLPIMLNNWRLNFVYPRKSGLFE